MSRFYAKAVIEAKLDMDILFGPAYKGIPLVSSMAIALYEYYNLGLSFCFNRKKQKSYCEGGSLVGSELKGKVLIVDDVIRAALLLENVHK